MYLKIISGGLLILSNGLCFSQDSSANKWESVLDKVINPPKPKLINIRTRNNVYFIKPGVIEMIPFNKIYNDEYNIYDSAKKRTYGIGRYFFYQKKEAECCLPFTTTIEIQDTLLVCYHFTELEFAPNSKVTVPVCRQLFLFTDDSMYCLQRKYLFDEIVTINDQYNRTVLAEYRQKLKKYKGLPFLKIEEGVAGLIIRLFLCAVSGYPETAKIFENLGERAEFQIEGGSIMGEVYEMWKGMYYDVMANSPPVSRQQ